MSHKIPLFKDSTVVGASAVSSMVLIGTGAFIYYDYWKDKPQAYAKLGDESFSNGKYDEAISHYDKAIEKCPEKNLKELAIFYKNRASAYEKLGKWRNVEQDSTRSIEYNPKYSVAYYQRARANEALNNVADCLYDITAACVLESFKNNIFKSFAQRVCEKSAYEDAKKYKRTEPLLPSSSVIRTFFRSYVHHPVIKLNIRNEPNKLHGFLRAKFALDNGLYEDVIASCSEEIKDSSSKHLHKALLLRGTFYSLSGFFEHAKRDFDSIIDNALADRILRTYALIERASLNVQYEIKDAGMADFKAAEDLSPSCPDVYYQRAQAFLLNDNFPHAFYHLKRVVEMVPYHAVAHVQKCFTQYKLAVLTNDSFHLDQAMKGFQLCIAKFPDCVECYTTMATALCDQKQFTSADHLFKKAIDMEPDNGSFYVQRGMSLFEWKDDCEEVLEIFNQATAIDAKCESAYEHIAHIEVQRGNFKVAVEMFEKAISLVTIPKKILYLCRLRNALIAQIRVAETIGHNDTEESIPKCSPCND